MFIIKKILNLNSIVFIFILVITIFISVNEFINIKELREIKNKINNDELVTNNKYEELSLYSSAYLLGKQGEYENAIEKYNILLKLYPTSNVIDVIYFNIGTVYLRDALSKPLSDDSKLTIENFQKLQSAIKLFLSKLFKN